MSLGAGLLMGTAGAVLLAAATGLSGLFERDEPACRSESVSSATAHADHAGHKEHHGERDRQRDDGGRDPHRADDRGPQVLVTDTCNTVELVGPSDSRYVPDVARASAADRAEARQLLAGVNDFCKTNTAAALLEAKWRPGLANPSDPTHFFNPDPRSRGLDPQNPRAALVYDGELSGVMFTGQPLAYLGAIPRAHHHGPSQPVDMLHVYCTDSLREAFTPNRMLGVNADAIALRQAIRPAVIALDDRRLRAALAYVRQHTGGPDRPVPPPPSALDGPHPQRQAKRIELRTSLTALDEPQLRDVRALMRS